MTPEKKQTLPETTTLSEQLLLAYITEDREWKRGIEQRLENVEKNRPVAITPQTAWLLLIVFALAIAVVIMGLDYVRNSGFSASIMPLLQGIEMTRQFLQGKQWI